MKARADIVAFFGGTGSGKSLSVALELARRKPKRLVIWDLMRDHGKGCEQFTTIPALYARARELKPGDAFKICYWPGSRNQGEEFDLVCEIAYRLGDLVLVVEELAFVTAANSAPPGWKKCTSTGRHRHLQLIGTSQRPASVDKHFFSNATRIRTGRLNFGDDIKTLANIINAKPEDITALAELEYIERDLTSGKITRGKLKIPR